MAIRSLHCPNTVNSGLTFSDFPAIQKNGGSWCFHGVLPRPNLITFINNVKNIIIIIKTSLTTASPFFISSIMVLFS